MKKLKIYLLSCGSHSDVVLEPIYEAFLERGHDAIIFHADILTHPDLLTHTELPEGTDVVFLASNAFNQRSVIEGRHVRSFFVPHGIGAEFWDPRMNSDTKVFLPGKQPWIPPLEVNNWKIVGWTKTDALHHPDREKIGYAKNLMEHLPFEQSVMFIPLADSAGVPHAEFLIEYFQQKQINIIIPFREYTQAARKYFEGYPHIGFIEIQNLYYFVPYIKVLICSGCTSVGREFYITKVPVMHIYHGFPETRVVLNNPDVDIEHFDPLFSQVWNNPERFLQPESVAEEFIGINDGKVVERIVEEIEGGDND